MLKRNLCLSSVPPSIDGPAEESVVETISNPVIFSCDATGIPPPSLTWLKNGRPIGMHAQFIISLWYNSASVIQFNAKRLHFMFV